MRLRNDRAGFVLLLTLVLIIIAGAALAGVARMSVEGALESRDAADELKRRWAIVSSRKALLGRIDGLFEKAERGDAEKGYANPPVRELRFSCRLADIDYEFIMFDEQAKLNMNHYFEKNSTTETLVAVRKLSRGKSGAADNIEFKLRPFITKTSEKDDELEGLSRFNSYGQLYSNATPTAMIGLRSGEGLAGEITCWGDGRINLRRASAEVIELQCKKTFGPGFTRRLIAARNDKPYADMESMLKTIKADKADKIKADKFLATSSNCYGMWTVANGRGRKWYSLAVCILGEAEQPKDDEIVEHRDVMCEYIFSW